MSSEGPNKARWFSPYRYALKAISIRTGTPLPSLAVSFAVLHELTAIVPLVGVFYGARALGVGERIVTAVVEGDPDLAFTRYSWVRENCKTWVDDGENWAARVGKRYDVFGFEKGQSASSSVVGKHHLVGDVANAVFAYGLTKVSHDIGVVVIDARLTREALVGTLTCPHRNFFVFIACVLSGHRRANSH